MVHQFTGFVLLSVSHDFSCPGSPDLSSECCKVSRGKPVRGKGREEGAEMESSAGWACLPFPCWGGGGAEEGPMPGFSRCLCLHQLSVDIKEPEWSGVPYSLKLGLKCVWSTGALSWGIPCSGSCCGSRSPIFFSLSSTQFPAPFPPSGSSFFATRFCVCCSSPALCDPWQDNV